MSVLYLMLLGAVQFSQQFNVNLGASSESSVILAVVVLRTAVWILGTIATIVFIFSGHRDGAGNDA